MEQNLEGLAADIQQYLEAEHFIVYHSMSRLTEDLPAVFWDHRNQPDFRRFLECAQQVGVRLVHYHARQFDEAQKESALDMLEDSEFTREEQREMERRIQAMTRYEGLLCAVEISFDFEGRTYMYAVETDWFEEWETILDELEDALGEKDDEEGGYGGFYSNN